MEKTTVSGSKPAQSKQIVAVVVLSLLLVGVGVWQWQSLAGGAPEQKPSNTPKSSTTAASSTPAQSALASEATTLGERAPFAPRDPFKPYSAPSQEQGTKVVAQRKPSGNSSPKGLEGVPPVPPLTLPAPSGSLQLEPSQPQPEPQRIPQWDLTGVVQGPKSVAILKDREGNRRFVQQGDTLEDGWRVHRIERGQIVLKKANEHLLIRVGQSTQANSGGPKE